MPTTLVSYLRVSTARQGRSGLGLDAQRLDVQHYATSNSAIIVKEFIEVESGRRSDRPALREALTHARVTKSKIVVAKLDRLGRNVAFLSALMEAKVEFIAIDVPNGNRLSVHVMAAMAEYERELISARTKAALRQCKERGTPLGSARAGHWEGREDRRRAGAVAGASRAAEAHQSAADAAAMDVAPIILRMRAESERLSSIADHLNKDGIPTRRGKQWTPTSVRNVLRRLGHPTSNMLEGHERKELLERLARKEFVAPPDPTSARGSVHPAEETATRSGL